MMKPFETYFLALAGALLAACSTGTEIPESPEYTNPVSTLGLADPTVIRGDDGYFYLYATENIAHIPVMRSTDLVNWKQIGTAFSRSTRPDFYSGGNLWAPDINKIGDKYVLYYSLSKMGEMYRNGIGVASADSPAGPFKDHGKLFTSTEIEVTNSIDQFYIEEDGKKYLFWGSFFGLYYIELSDDGLSLKPGAEKVKVAGNAYEAIYIHKRDNHYYLFASIGTCCEGLNSTYALVVGRSQFLRGPYTNRSGGQMLDNQHEPVLKGNSNFAGPGHNAEIITDNAGQDWMLYHGYDRLKPNMGRVLLLDRVRWVDGWPQINDGGPSRSAPGPVF